MTAASFWRLLAGALLLCLAPLPAGAAERILSFNSRLIVQPDSRLSVTETIRVQSESREIRHGIYRDFPTDYRGAAGERVHVGLRLVAVERDGHAEPWHSEQLTDGLRIYIGDKDVIVPVGEHIYRLVYETTRQLGFFKTYDELYWNVTGNGWAFPIERVRAVVVLPPGGRMLDSTAYTGPAGSTASEAKIEALGGGEVAFSASRVLPPHEGLTIAVSWPKGLVAEPSGNERVAWLLSDNAGTALAGLGLILLLAWYIFAWFKAGRDPAAGPVVPLFSPPKGLSPAACRFVSRMGFDHKVLSAALVGLAVKGYLKIDQDARDFAATRTVKELGEDLDRAEKKLLSSLFPSGGRIDFKRGNHRRIQAAESALKTALALAYEKKAFVTNTGLLTPGLALSLVVLVGLAFSSNQTAASGGIILWLTFWSVGCYVVARAVAEAWRSARNFGLSLRALGTTLFALPFFLGELGGVYALTQNASWPAVAIFIVTLGADLLFYHLLKAPTRSGRDLLDKIEGYKLFLSVAEKDRLAALNPPEITPAIFEAGLAYALALDVEQAWAERFAADMAKAGRDPAAYQPMWYGGSHWQLHGPSGFTRAIGSSLAGSIAAGASPPGRSSGSSGGGSSGGGGGGGGGGGW